MNYWNTKCVCIKCKVSFWWANFKREEEIMCIELWSWIWKFNRKTNFLMFRQWQEISHQRQFSSLFNTTKMPSAALQQQRWMHGIAGIFLFLLTTKVEISPNFASGFPSSLASFTNITAGDKLWLTTQKLMFHRNTTIHPLTEGKYC